MRLEEKFFIKRFYHSVLYHGKLISIFASCILKDCLKSISNILIRHIKKEKKRERKRIFLKKLDLFGYFISGPKRLKLAKTFFLITFILNTAHLMYYMHSWFPYMFIPVHITYLPAS